MKIRAKNKKQRGPVAVFVVLMLAALPILANGAEIIPEGMVSVPDGEFLMGSPLGEGDSDERPQRAVSVNALYMDKHEVTNAEYKAFLDAAGYGGRKDADANYLKHWENGTYPSDQGDHPVIRVSWKNAQAFATWAGKYSLRVPERANMRLSGGP